MPSVLRQLVLFTDYFQFYVSDEGLQTDTSQIWNKLTSATMLAVGPDLIAVGTARNKYVPVQIGVYEAAPDADFDLWDQVYECGLGVPSGKLIVFGCTEDASTAAQFETPPGDYVARVSYANLNQISDDDLTGEDKYRVQLWPGVIPPFTLLKSRTR